MAGVAGGINAFNADLDRQRKDALEERRMALAESLGKSNMDADKQKLLESLIANRPEGAEVSPEQHQIEESAGMGWASPYKPEVPATLDSLGPTVGDPWGKMSLPSPSISPRQSAGFRAVPPEPTSYRNTVVRNEATAQRQQATLMAKSALQTQMIEARNRWEAMDEATKRSALGQQLLTHSQDLAQRYAALDQTILQNAERNAQAKAGFDISAFRANNGLDWMGQFMAMQPGMQGMIKPQIPIVNPYTPGTLLQSQTSSAPLASQVPPEKRQDGAYYKMNDKEGTVLRWRANPAPGQSNWY